MVNLEFSEFFYSQRPLELAEYRRRKGLKRVEADNAKAEELAEDIQRNRGFRTRKKGRKRNGNKCRRRQRFKGGNQKGHGKFKK